MPVCSADDAIAFFGRCKAGLKPGVAGHYFQPVQFTKVSLNPSQSSLALLKEGHATPIPVPAEAQLRRHADDARHARLGGELERAQPRLRGRGPADRTDASDGLPVREEIRRGQRQDEVRTGRWRSKAAAYSGVGCVWEAGKVN